ncbi:toll/interleukin-1 receptor domain-containing protein [Paenibacillus sp. FSL R10-2736]|uniref:toll/interleukin-1 receptor domain-containing protein n=1 Tax=Paenibacillus sp. FSL R10-2736 TaxID=2954692 RepID=UPI0030F8C2FF
MIFFCFSSKDRKQIVEALLFHITNFELPVWYDRHKMLMGDERDYKNFDEGVAKAHYAIIVLSPNAIASVCAQEEIAMLHKQYKSGKTTVFPLFYNLKASEVPEELGWMKKLVYKEMNAELDARSACNHIICRYLLDELGKYRFQTINAFLKWHGDNAALGYVAQLLKAYTKISDENVNAQIALLYAACLFMKSNYRLGELPDFYYAGVDRLFDETRLYLSVDLRETLILERLTLLLINSVLFGYIV